VLFNSADISYSSQRESFLLEADYTGQVRWMFPDILKSYCELDIRFFPFDRLVFYSWMSSFHFFYFFISQNFVFFRQKCILEFQSWARSQKELLVINDMRGDPNADHTIIHTEWKILNISTKALEKNDYVWLEYSLFLERNSDFYGKKNFKLNI
jgi:hypothetical protein